MLIDTHAHLDFKEFDQDRDQVIKRAFSSGIEKIINVGCNLERSKNSIELARKYDNIYAAVGVHPHDVGKYKACPERSRRVGSLKSELTNLAKQDKVVAIGECGLDYYRIKNDELRIKNLQKEFFKLQLDLARELDLPIIIHCRNAFEDLLEILKETNDLPKGVTHCFSGTLHYAKQFLNLGFLISFTGNVTYVRPQGELLKVVKEVPLEKIMVETDSPYLAPVPHRGERNEPAYVKHVAEKIAELKNLDFEKVAEKTSQTATQFFNLR